MKANKLIRKIKMYFLTGNWEDPKVKKIVEFFDEIFNNMIEYYSDDYPESTFYKYNDKIYFKLDLKDGFTWCRYKDFWKKFETDFELDYKEIKELIQYFFGMHLKRKILFPVWLNPTDHQNYTDEYWLGMGTRTNLKRKVLPTMV